MYYKTSAEPRTHIDGVPVFCAYDELVPIDRLVPNPKNPNKHPAKQIKKLEGIIRSTGWRNNITVSLRSGMIVKGHGRYLAAQKLGASCVPVEYQDYTSEAEEYADMEADNRLAELSQTDKKALAGLLTLIQEDVPLELAGFDAIPLVDDDPIDLDEPAPETEPEEEKATCHCPKCGFVFEVPV